MATTRKTINSMLLILGGICALLGAFTLVMGDSWVWTVASLMCALLLVGMLTGQRTREDSSPSSDQANKDKMSADHLSSMTPPGWDAIPPTVNQAVQPDAYLHNRHKNR